MFFYSFIILLHLRWLIEPKNVHRFVICMHIQWEYWSLTLLLKVYSAFLKSKWGFVVEFDPPPQGRWCYVCYGIKAVDGRRWKAMQGSNGEPVDQSPVPSGIIVLGRAQAVSCRSIRSFFPFLVISENRDRRKKESVKEYQNNNLMSLLPK